MSGDEIGCGGHVDSAALEGDWRAWCDDCHYAVRARLAEVEAERDAMAAKLALPCGSCHPCTNWVDEDWRRAGRKPPPTYEWDETRARLAAVLALCDGLEQMNAPDMHPELHEVCGQVRAAAAGDDRD